MAGIRATVKLNQQFGKNLNRISGFQDIGPQVKEMIRFGKGSVNAQFITQSTISFGSVQKWKAKVNPWGDRKAQRSSAGQDSGRWKEAWLGSSAGSFSRTTKGAVTVGVQRSQFPQVNVLMADGPTTWYPKKRVGNNWAARIFHGMVNNVWLSNATYAKGFIHNPRAISMNDKIERRVARFVELYAAWLLDPVNNRKPRPIK